MPPWSCPRCSTANAGQAAACVACGTQNPALAQPTQQFSQPPQPYGAPPQQYGVPAPSPYGQPTQEYGGPPQQYAPPPQPYGQPAQQPGATLHGLPPQQYGQQPPQYQAPQFGAPPPPQQGYQPPGSSGWGVPPPPPRKGNRALLIGLVAAVAVIGAVIAIVLLTRGSSSPANARATATATAKPTPSPTPKPTPTPSVSGTGNLILPNSIAGETKVDDPSLQQSLQAQADSVRKAGATGAVAGAYGTSATSPDRAVFAASGDHPATVDFTHYLATQFASGAGVTLDEASVKTIDENGTAMSCWTLSQSGSPVGAYCGWNDVVTVGFSVQFASPDLQECADFTAAARTAILNQG